MTQYINSGSAAFVQYAARAAVVEGEPFVKEIRERCRLGVEAAYSALSESNSIVLPAKPKAGMYVNFAVAGEDDGRESCFRILDEAQVGLAPGFLFGESSKRFMRMCICRDTADIAEASRRIAETLRRDAGPARLAARA
jgi:aspartate/methionine/tyrosine aminotransferase